MADDPKNPFEQLAEILIYAPLGAAAETLETLPATL